MWLFTQEDPALEKRFSLNLTAANAAYGSFRAEVAAWLDGATRIYEYQNDDGDDR
ncbi:hypothetical protein [Sphingomonas zeae]|jgi:hypothetical protein